VNEAGPLIKGALIGGLGIFHVFLAQFAIGGGGLMCYFQWLAQTGREPDARRLLDSYFRTLVLVSFVVGALTGVGMWFTTIQVSPRTIGLMVDHFHWLWAIEYTFFWLEVVAGYTFYRYGKILSDPARMKLLVAYTAAAWFSLFWINGILSWQLTPGAWVETRSVWSGFFNPSFWPSLAFRTVVSATLAALAACIVINTVPELDRAARTRLIHRAAHFMAPMALLPLFGAWFLLVIPPDSRSWAMGGSIAMTMFLGIAVAASLLIGGYAFLGLLRQRLFINGATATLLLALAFGATAGGEFVREGVRKPYTIRETLFSNAVRPEEVLFLRRVGSVTNDPFPLRNAAALPTEELRTGMKVFRFQCSVCHTLGGMNGLAHLTGSWDLEQMRGNIAKLQQTKPFMPPFAGTAHDVEALVQLLAWHRAGSPASWPSSSDAGTLAKIDAWLDEAGPAAFPPDRPHAAPVTR